MSRDLGSSMTSRAGGDSLLRRGPSNSLSNRTTESGAASRKSAAAATGVEIRYVDRYVYVDGSMVTATVFEMYFAWGDVSTRKIFSLLAGAVIAEVNVWMLEEFNGVGPVVTIGRDTDHDELMDVTELNTTLLSSFSTRPGKEYSAGDAVNLYLNPGAGASAGRGVISIYII